MRIFKFFMSLVIMSKEFTNNQEIIILTTNLKRGNYFVKMSIDNITKYQKIIKE